MQISKVPGRKRRHKVFVYTISTCAWCRKTKKFLEDNNVEYEYVDVDLCNREDRERVRSQILSKGGRLSYPAIIIDDEILINGFRKDKIRENLEV